MNNKENCMQTKLIIIFVLLSFATIKVENKEVDSFNLLLPTAYHPSKGHTSQLVVTEGGCYDWDSTDPSIVSVKGTHQGSKKDVNTGRCFSNGLVQLHHEGRYSSSVYITAKDQQSSELASIPVRIRDLKRISIFTKSKVMNLREVQNLEVYGFDEENNTFTSLEGLRFKWTIYQQGNQEGNTGSIEKIPLKDSSLYLPLDFRKKIQAEEGVETDLLVVQAKRVGRVLIKVQCLDSNYEQITDEITLYIQQRFDIWPSSVQYIMAGSTYQYYLMTPSGHNITLPTSYYSIQVTNSYYQISDTLMIKSPQYRDDKTELIISDTRTKPHFINKVQIFSYLPDQIDISLDRDTLITDESVAHYKVSFLHEGRKLAGSIDRDKVFVTLIAAQGTAESNVNQVFDLNINEQTITSSHQSECYLQVTYGSLVSKKKITSMTPLKPLLPSDNNKIILPVGETYQIKVIGGSGLYKYQLPSSQSKLLILSYNGLINTKSEGITNIIVADEKNPENQLTLTLEIHRIGSIQSLQQFKQFNLQQDNFLYIGARVLNSNQFFTECNDALMKGLSLIPIGEGNPPLQVTNNYPVETEILEELRNLSREHYFLGQILSSRSNLIFSEEELLKKNLAYIQAKQIKIEELLQRQKYMNNYGLCVKLGIKPIGVYDGQVIARKIDEIKGEGRLKVRVYESIRSAIRTQNGGNQDFSSLIMTPKSSFLWETEGGPTPWTSASSENVIQTSVFLNEAELQQQNQNSYERIVPTIYCPTEITELNFNLRFKNRATLQLPLPVSQQKKITVYCERPKKIDLRLPQNIVVPKDSTLYIYPKQSFDLYATPIPVNEKQNFYNCSNVQYKVTDVIYAEIFQKRQGENGWNIQYQNSHRKFNSLLEDDKIGIEAYIEQIPDFSIKGTILVKSIQPLNLLMQKNREIILPNNPSNIKKFQIDDSEGTIMQGRVKVLCDDGQVAKCFNEGNKFVVIAPSTIGSTTLRVVDQLVVGSPAITIPLNVISINEVQLSVVRIDSNDESWLFEGEQFVANIKVYGSKRSLINSSLSNMQKIPISDIDVHSLQVSIDGASYAWPDGNRDYDSLQQLSRNYDFELEQVLIKYRAPFMSHNSLKSNNEHTKDKQIPLSLQVYTSSSSKSYASRISSNRVSVIVYPVISVEGADILPQLDRNQKTQEHQYPVVYRSQISTKATIMETCVQFIKIIGGPSHLKTQITSNPSEDYFYKVEKVSERVFKIEAMQTTESLENSDLTTLTGGQKNIVMINLFDNTRGHYKTVKIQNLIIVSPIHSFHIMGIDSLLVGRDARYLLQFSSRAGYDKQRCSINYKWLIKNQNSHNQPYIDITSDNERNGVNATAKPPISVNEMKKSSTAENEIVAVLINIYGKQIGRTSKIVTVVAEDNSLIIGEEYDEDGEQNGMYLVRNDEILLIPPKSGLRLPDGSKAEELSPCALQSSEIMISADKRTIITKGGTPYPETIKITSSQKSSALPIFTNVFVTEVCGVIVENVDGMISASPKGKGSRQSQTWVKVTLIDCLGRTFPGHQHLMNIQINTFTRNPQIAEAVIDGNTGMIGISGHKIGKTDLLVQVTVDGGLKARDVLPISVNLLIIPSRPVTIHIGGNINFGVPDSVHNLIKGKKDKSGKWTTNDEAVMTIDRVTGKASARRVGKCTVQFAGGMATEVSVVKLIDLKKDRKISNNVYTYQPVYSGQIFENYEEIGHNEKERIVNNLQWNCQINGPLAKYFKAKAVVEDGSISQKQKISCIIERIPGISHEKISSKTLLLTVSAINEGYNFYFSKTFQEDELDIIVVLSDRKINPQVQDSPYHVIVETKQKLTISQVGGKDECIIDNQFNGSTQVISLNLILCRNHQWSVIIFNPKNNQREEIIITSQKEKEQKIKSYTPEEEQKNWKWTDILVVFMAINFAVICVYQYVRTYGNSSGGAVY